MSKIPKISLNTPMQNAFQYTLFISVLYIIYKFFDIDAPKGSAFIDYIIPMVLTNIIFVVFPILFVVFYVKDSSAIGDIKETLLEKNDPQIQEYNNQEMLRKYHGMLKDGIITEEEYEKIKKKYLKDL